MEEVMKQNRKKIDWNIPRFNLADTSVLFVSLLVISILVTILVTSGHYRYQACKRGFATWEIKNRAIGSAKFTWKSIDNIFINADN